MQTKTESPRHVGSSAIVRRQRGVSRFFTWTYWRIQIGRVMWGEPPLNIVETFQITLPDDPPNDQAER